MHRAKRPVQRTGEGEMTTGVAYEKTADGDVAARVAHLVISLIPQRGGGMRTLTAFTRSAPSEVRRSEFHPGSFRSTDEAGFRRDVEAYARHHEELAALGRSRIPDSEARRLATPWGTPGSATRYAEGVLSVDCPQHGGLMLSEAVNARVHETWRATPDTRGWAFYEEDDMSAVVRHHLPELFTGWERAGDDERLARSMPDEWRLVAGTTAGRTVPPVA